MNNIKKYNDFISVFKPFEVNEGLIKTHDPAQMLLSFSRLRRMRDINSVINYDANGRLFIKCKDINKDDAEFILSLIGNFGYFVAEMTINDIDIKFDENNFIEICFYNKEKIDVIFHIEAKYDINIENIQKYYYHATPINNIEKILKNGLSPKSKNKLSAHPPRIFLANNLNNAIAFARFAKSGMSKPVDITILEIDTTKIKPLISYNGTEMPFKIYNDPNYTKKGFYTLNNIPREAIEDLKKII